MLYVFFFSNRVAIKKRKKPSFIYGVVDRAARRMLVVDPVWDRVCFASEPKKRIKPAKQTAADARCLAAAR